MRVGQHAKEEVGVGDGMRRAAVWCRAEGNGPPGTVMYGWRRGGCRRAEKAGGLVYSASANIALRPHREVTTGQAAGTVRVLDWVVLR